MTQIKYIKINCTFAATNLTNRRMIYNWQHKEWANFQYNHLTISKKATATRDLQHLVKIGVLFAQCGGRSLHYKLNI